MKYSAVIAKVILLMGSLTVLLSSMGCTSTPELPNVVVILADDQGWGDLSVSGNTNLSTPNIDSLARDGARFENFYVCQVCSPTRAEFLTGRYHARGGVYGTSTGAERLNIDEKTIAETFKNAGYATGVFGKWHNGTQHPYHPNARGFDEFYGFASGHWGNYFDPILEHNGEIVRGKGYIIDDLTDHALGFMEKNRRGPFFCYLPYNVPHSPMQVPDRFYEKFDGVELGKRNRDPELEEVPKTRAALAMCEAIDWNVGRVLEKLNEWQLTENTIVIYFSDNGPNSWRWNGGMKGRKGAIDEGGLRVPFMIRWPGHIQAGLEVSQIAAAIDLLPTLSDLAGISVVSTKKLDGVSVKPLLLGDADGWPDRRLFSFKIGSERRPPQASVRTQQYRLDAQGKLFDIAADRGQDIDISSEKPELVAELMKEAEAWANEMQKSVAPDNRAFPVGYGDSTPLPARDGVVSGGVERSAKAPNCSYFTNWTSLEDQISWDVEVGRGGRYEAIVYYTCPAEDVGSKFELRFLDNKVDGQVLEAHDPPLVGAESDRVPRSSESLVKDFKPLSLGTIALQQGRGMMSLRALEIPGKQVMDVRAVVLNWIDE